MPDGKELCVSVIKNFFNAEGAEEQSGRGSKDRAGIRKALLYSVIFERSFFYSPIWWNAKLKQSPRFIAPNGNSQHSTAEFRLKLSF